MCISGNKISALSSAFVLLKVWFSTKPNCHAMPDRRGSRSLENMDGAERAYTGWVETDGRYDKVGVLSFLWGISGPSREH